MEQSFVSNYQTKVSHKRIIWLTIFLLLLVLVAVWLYTAVYKPSSRSKVTKDDINKQEASLQLTQTSTDPPDKTYSNSKYQISTVYPGDWQVSEIDRPTVVAKFSRIGDGQDILKDHLIIQVEGGDYTQTLKDLIARKETDIKKLNNAKIIEAEPIKFGVDSLSGYKIIYEADFADITSAKNMLVFAIKDSKAYVISYNTNSVDFDKNMKKALNMINQFKFQE